MVFAKRVNTTMIIPFEQLSEGALRGLIEEFITRDGTDYGFNEVSLETKVKQVKSQIQRGDVVIAFDPASEAVTLLTQLAAKQAGLTD